MWVDEEVLEYLTGWRRELILLGHGSWVFHFVLVVEER